MTATEVYASALINGTTVNADTLFANTITAQTDNFDVLANGNIATIKNIDYSFPDAQATANGQFLKNNGSGNLAWNSAYRAQSTGFISLTETGGTAMNNSLTINIIPWDRPIDTNNFTRCGYEQHSSTNSS